ncbi:MAG TPA: carbohydrate kinase family protein [Alphaproteobacteria bacterium]|nr:carbohydrate kinase family protein [Alphaproteobacteria bacterium]
MTAAIACFGAAHIDHKAHAAGSVRLGTSNPVTIVRSPGGVARNVAESLARLGCRIALVSRLGRDRDGDQVAGDIAGLGVDISFSGRSESGRTAGYTALLDGRGELVVAMADMAIYDEVTPDLVEPLLPALAAYPVWFLDTNFPDGTVRFLLDHRPPEVVLVAVDAVSVAKADKLRGQLDRIDLLIANRDEIGFLADMEIRAPLDVCEAANRLRAEGVGTIAVNMGADGSFLASDRTYDFLPAMPARVCDVTGAGDALTAGVLYGQANGRPIAEAMRLGLANAALTIECPETVNPSLTPDLLMARAELRS